MTATNCVWARGCCHVSHDGWLPADPHLAHVDPVDGGLPAQLLNKLPLLLELLQFSLVGKHRVLSAMNGCVGITLGDSLNVTLVMCGVSSMSDGGGVDARLVG